MSGHSRSRSPQPYSGPVTRQRGAEGIRNRFAGDISFQQSDLSSYSGHGRGGAGGDGRGGAGGDGRGGARRPPLSPQEQLLAQHTKKGRTDRKVDCSICMTSLAEESPYAEKSSKILGSLALNLCGHQFHASCLHQLAAHDTSCLTCPNCFTIHGVRTGNQPTGGDMEVVKMLDSLPGFEDYRTIRIRYSFTRGVQGPEHPHPGRPYRLQGFPRVAYLPDTDKGNRVRKLLKAAFDRRLVFTVGTSTSTGTPDCIVWNGIHHKTQKDNFGGHGYPDPSYLDNVMKELAAFGVTEESIEHNA